MNYFPTSYAVPFSLLETPNRTTQNLHWRNEPIWGTKIVSEQLNASFPSRKSQSESPVDVRVEAERILNNALIRYRRPDGYEGYLVDAAWQLEQIGPKAISAIEALMHTRAPECEFFLGAVVHMKGVSKQERLTALLEAARNPDLNIRSRLMELLDEMPNDMRESILKELADQNQIDEAE